MENPFLVFRFLRLLRGAMKRLLNGDLTQKIDLTGSGVIPEMARDFNSIVEKLCEVTVVKDDLAREKLSCKEMTVRFTDLMNNLKVGVYRNTAGPHGSFLDVNLAMVELFEASSKEELMRHTVSDLYFDHSQRASFSKKLAENGYVRCEELELITLKGRRFWASITAVAHRNDRGEVFFDGIVEDVSERKRAQENLRKNFDIQATLAKIMSISLEKISIQELLELILNEILDISWLSLDSRGGIFLVEDDPHILLLKAQKNLPVPVQAMCSSVLFGRCLCGRAAKTGEIVFSAAIEEQHENLYTNIDQHGHYCLPFVLTGGRVVGVAVLYLKPGYVRNADEESFLLTLGKVVAAIIERKRMEIRLIQKVEEIDKLNYFMIGREKRIVELKKEVDNILKESGKPPHYNIL